MARIPRELAQTLRVVLAHFAAIGVAPDAQRRALQEALRRTDEPLQRHEASALHAARARVELLAAWHRQSRYLDDRGQPLSLSLQGTPLLSELFECFLPTSDPKGLASELLAEGVIDRDTPGRWRPARRTLLVATNSDGALERLPFQIHALLSTLAHSAVFSSALTVSRFSPGCSRAATARFPTSLHRGRNCADTGAAVISALKARHCPRV